MKGGGQRKDIGWGGKLGPGLLVVWEEERGGVGESDLEGRGTVPELQVKGGVALPYPQPHSWALREEPEQWEGRGEQRFSWFRAGGAGG